MVPTLPFLPAMRETSLLNCQYGLTGYMLTEVGYQLAESPHQLAQPVELTAGYVVTNIEFGSYYGL